MEQHRAVRAVLRNRVPDGLQNRLRRAASNVLSHECETVYDTQEVSRQVPVWETEMRERRFKVMRPVQETSMREERFCVQRPVYETQMRDASYDVVRNVIETAEREERYIVAKPVVRNTDARRALLRAAAGHRDCVPAAMPNRDAARDDVPNAIC